MPDISHHDLALPSTLWLQPPSTCQFLTTFHLTRLIQTPVPETRHVPIILLASGTNPSPLLVALPEIDVSQHYITTFEKNLHNEGRCWGKVNCGAEAWRQNSALGPFNMGISKHKRGAMFSYRLILVSIDKTWKEENEFRCYLVICLNKAVNEELSTTMARKNVLGSIWNKIEEEPRLRKLSNVRAFS